MTGWLPRPPDDTDAATLRRAIDAVLELVTEHRDTAGEYRRLADQAAADGRDGAAEFLRGQTAMYEGAADHLVEALVDALGLHAEYEAAVAEERGSL